MGFFRRGETRAGSGEVQYEDALLKSILGGGGVTKDMAMQIPTVSGGIDPVSYTHLHYSYMQVCRLHGKALLEIML